MHPKYRANKLVIPTVNLARWGLTREALFNQLVEEDSTDWRSRLRRRKIVAVLVIDSGLTVSEAARASKSTYIQVEAWVQAFNLHGPEFFDGGTRTANNVSAVRAEARRQAARESVRTQQSPRTVGGFVITCGM